MSLTSTSVETSEAGLALLDRVATMLREARSVEDVKNIRDKAEAIRTYAHRAKLGFEVQNRAAELRLRSERKAGVFLAALQLHGGDRRSTNGRRKVHLSELGISKNQSRDWQLMAQLQDSEFARYVQASNSVGQELTTAGLLRFAQARSAKKRPDENSEPSARRDQHRPRSRPRGPLDELREHCHVLSSILKPVYSNSQDALDDGQRRHVSRLLNEMRGFIERLENDLN